jgi:hypothetical protein
MTEEVSILMTGSINFGNGRVDANASYALLDSDLGYFDFPATDYVSFWHFDKANGSNATFTPDETGRHNGTVIGAVNGSPGKVQEAYFYNASALDYTYINLGNVPDFKVASKTIAFWLKSYNSASVFSNYPNYGIEVYGGDLEVSWYNSSNLPVSLRTQTFSGGGSWNYWVVSFNATGSTVNVTIYKNGQLLNSTQNNQGYGTAYNDSFTLGIRRDLNNMLTGFIDELVFYNYSINSSVASEMYTWYNTGAVGGTWSYNRSYMNLENDGTVNVRINVSADKNAANFIGGTSPAFQIKGVATETGACSNLQTNYFSVPNSTQTPVTLCYSLNFSNWKDGFEIPVKLKIPTDAPPGARNSTITFSASKV